MINPNQVSFGQKISDLIANAVKSWKFVIFQLIAIAFWVYLNTAISPFQYKWDKYPFEILKLSLAIEASFIASMILMNQSRRHEKDRKVMLSDYYLEVQIRNEVRNLKPSVDRIEARLIEIEKHQK